MREVNGKGLKFKDKLAKMYEHISSKRWTQEHNPNNLIVVFICWPTYPPLNIDVSFLSHCSVVDKNTALGRDPRDVAQAVLRAVRQRSKDVVLAGPLPTLAIYLRTLWPALFFKLMSSRARKEQKSKDEWSGWTRGQSHSSMSEAHGQRK